VDEFDVALPGGRTLHGYDTGEPAGGARLTVIWHHGTPNVGPPPAPLFPAGDRLGVRWLAYDRPGYGGSTPRPGRTVGDAAADTAAIADARGANRFALLGHSGGGPHALAVAARRPDRAVAVAAVAGLAPFGAEALDWFAGMAESGAASLRAAAAGRAAKERFEAENAEGDPEFTPGDLAALAGPWSWFGPVVMAALAGGRRPLIDDDLAYVAPWGFDPAEVAAPVLLVHGGADRLVPAAHRLWLAGRCASAEAPPGRWAHLGPGERGPGRPGVAGRPGGTARRAPGQRLRLTATFTAHGRDV
jgi:pimeloyl-ACP methyl ester carboxylesterase